MLLTLTDFDLLSARSVAEACSLLHRYGSEARLFAGGTDLLVKMKHKRAGVRYLINIKGIPQLDFIHFHERDGLRIGALTTIQAIRDSALVSQHCPPLHQAAARMGTLHIRNLGTLGGNLANASPAAEFAPALLTLEASVSCTGRESTRSLPLGQFFVAPGRSALQHDEILTEIRVPAMPAGAVGCYVKHGLRRMDVAIASAAVLVAVEDGVLSEARVALGAVAATPFRASSSEEALRGQRLKGGASEQELMARAAQVAADEASPIDDLRSDASYRKKAVAMLVEQALRESIQSARTARTGKSPRREHHEA